MKLAIKGGKPVIKGERFKKYNTIGKEEITAVNEVLKKGVLSGFVGDWSDKFYGGENVRKIETYWRKYIHSKYVIAMNSATSGLYASIGALGIGPGDEVIVSPYTMSASVMCVLVYNAVPVFVDVKKDTYCIDPDDIRRKITDRTKAIVVVHLFGHPAEMDSVIKIAREYNLKVIEDCAQAPAAIYKGKYVGTIGDIGIFSLNCHKTIQSGEGGLCTTNDNEIAFRLRLIRNHGEAVVSRQTKGEREKMLSNSIVNLIGWNYRMTEMESAVGIEQIKKLEYLNKKRIENCDYLTDKIEDISCLSTPIVYENCRHVYYIYALRYNSDIARINRNRFVRAVEAEGVPLSEGYVKPLYLLDIFQQKIAYGEKGCPFACPWYKGKVNYVKGICPNVESLHYKELIILPTYAYDFTKRDLSLISDAFHKVYENMNKL